MNQLGDLGRSPVLLGASALHLPPRASVSEYLSSDHSHAWQGEHYMRICQVKLSSISSWNGGDCMSMLYISVTSSPSLFLRVCDLCFRLLVLNYRAMRSAPLLAGNTLSEPGATLSGCPHAASPGRAHQTLSVFTPSPLIHVSTCWDVASPPATTPNPGVKLLSLKSPVIS